MSVFSFKRNPYRVKEQAIELMETQRQRERARLHKMKSALEELLAELEKKNVKSTH